MRGVERESDRRPRLADYPRLLAACRKAGPAFYAQHVLGVEPWAKQVEILEDFWSSDLTTVRSANGIGKSFLVGIALSCFADCYPDSEAILTSGTYRQAFYSFQGFRSLRLGARYRLPGRLLTNALWLGPKWSVRCFASRDETSFQGPHAENFAVAADESSAVRDEIFQAIHGSMTTEGSRLLMTGNPNSAAGYFARSFRDPTFRRHTISAFDTPNLVAGSTVIPQLVTAKFVDRMIRTYGPDSDVVRVRVHGLPPRHATASIFSLAAIETAQARGRDFDPDGDQLRASGFGERVGGLDVGERVDDSFLVTFEGPELSGLRMWEGGDVDVSTAVAAQWLDEGPGVLVVDAGGPGGGLVTTLQKRYPGRVIGVLFGSGPIHGETVANEFGEELPLYVNRRAEMYYQAAAWTLQRGAWDQNLPTELVERLEEDLLVVLGGFTEKGQFLAEKKDGVRRRLKRSPDAADAYVLAVSGILGGIVAGVLPRGERAEPARRGRGPARRTGSKRRRER